MEEIIRFVTLARTDGFTVSDLCEQFGISRKTAYKHQWDPGWAAVPNIEAGNAAAMQVKRVAVLGIHEPANV